MARADNEDRAFLQLREVAVVVGVKLGDARVELVRELRRVRLLEHARGGDDVVGLEATVAGIATKLPFSFVSASTGTPLRTGSSKRVA